MLTLFPCLLHVVNYSKNILRKISPLLYIFHIHQLYCLLSILKTNLHLYWSTFQSLLLYFHQQLCTISIHLAVQIFLFHEFFHSIISQVLPSITQCILDHFLAKMSIKQLFLKANGQLMNANYLHLFQFPRKQFHQYSKTVQQNPVMDNAMLFFLNFFSFSSRNQPTGLYYSKLIQNPINFVDRFLLTLSDFFQQESKTYFLTPSFLTSHRFQDMLLVP